MLCFTDYYLAENDLGMIEVMCGRRLSTEAQKFKPSAMVAMASVGKRGYWLDLFSWLPMC